MDALELAFSAPPKYTLLGVAWKPELQRWVVTAKRGDLKIDVSFTKRELDDTEELLPDETPVLEYVWERVTKRWETALRQRGLVLP